jgi:hypothetical protein
MMQSLMQNMNLQMQNMNTSMQHMNRNLNTMGQQLNTNLNNQMTQINRNQSRINRNVPNYSYFNIVPNRFSNNVTQIQTNSGNNNSVSTSIVYDSINHGYVVTITRNGVVSTYRIRDGENSNAQINQLINNGYLPNQELINSLPEREIVQSDLDSINEQKSCIICLGQFGLGEKVITLPCLHIFHSDCIKSWLNTSEECPICKHNIND